eukprot:m.167429 g.167429  ORF g.167429 m.167429 type:complete len:303 (+) comp38931_c0_seq2:1241-2149(+)
MQVAPPESVVSGTGTLPRSPSLIFSDVLRPLGYTAGAPPQKKSRASTPAFPMGNSLPPVPGRVVAKVEAREFVDFAELLTDNAELIRRETDRDRPCLAAPSRPPMRQLSSLLSWVQAFAAFAAVELTVRPHRIIELMAYLKLVVREAVRCGGDGWRFYDQQFRMQAAANPALSWMKLQSGLHSATFLSFRRPNNRVCTLCMEGDHCTDECSLYSLAGSGPKRPPLRSKRDGGAATSRSASSQVCRLFNYAASGCHFGSTCIYATSAVARIIGPATANPPLHLGVQKSRRLGHQNDSCYVDGD